MTLQIFMDYLFDWINENRELEVENISTDYRRQCFYVTLQGGRQIVIRFSEL